MGYYTYYKLEVLSKRVITDKEFDSLLKEMENTGNLPYALDIDSVREHDLSPAGSQICFTAAESAKWYYHDEDMLALSLKFPSFMFELFGNGEDEEDFWYTNYKNGKMQHRPAELVYPPLNESIFENDAMDVPILF